MAGAMYKDVANYAEWRDKQLAVAGEANATDVADDFPIEAFEDVCIIEQTIESTTASGIIVAGGAEKIPGGKVVAAGPGRYYFAAMNASQTMEAAVFVPNNVKKGDWVTFGRYQSGGEPIEWNGRRFLMARAGDLGGKSKDGKPIMLSRAKKD